MYQLVTSDGPTTDGYKEIYPPGSPFPTSAIWYTDATKVYKILEKLITRDSFQQPVQIQWLIYDSDGTTVIKTVTDTIVYINNVFELNRTRVVT